MRSFRNFSDVELIAFVDELIKVGQSNFVEQCEALYELDKRGVKHPLHKPKGKHNKIFAHYENVALGRLSPALVSYFNGHPGKLAKFVSYGPEIQRQIAGDRPFKIAAFDDIGAIVTAEKIVRKMSAIEMDFAFPGNGVLATPSEQAEKLASLRSTQPEVVAPKELVQPHSEKSIKVRGNVVTLDDLKATLESMGYEIVKK